MLDLKNKKRYDYSGFRLSLIGEPRFRHLLFNLGWIWYFAMYLLTEHLIPDSACHTIHCVVDDWIPFCEYFVLAYVFWYVLVAGSLIYFVFYDVESYKRLSAFILVTQVVAMIVYIVYPSIQYLRPTEFVHHNFCTWLLGIIYGADTPTGVCPSLHVAYSIGIASAWLKKKDEKAGIKIFVVIAVILICMAVNFVKQHSFVDVVAAIPVCILAETLAFGKSYWLPRFQEKGIQL